MSNDISMKNIKKEMLDLIETLKNEIKNKEKEFTLKQDDFDKTYQEKNLALNKREKEELLQKGFDGEINVPRAKISAFETLVKEQAKLHRKRPMRKFRILPIRLCPARQNGLEIWP